MRINSPPKDSWFIRLVTAVVLASMTVVILGIWVPTDYPQQPGDDWRAFGKVYIGIAVTWLFFRWYRRHRASYDSRSARVS